ncbi:hypothetical protein [Paraburkholderia sediminicola]|uniref:hypothetical protein n=1 Tax=Paraburkholderia sediminicola TaxID=458836 RepID=UPI0038B7A579
MGWMKTLVWRRREIGEGWTDETPDALVWVCITSLDTAWRVSEDYVGEAGHGSLHGDRYSKVGRWLESAKFVDVPVLCLDEDGVPSFTDGRHRFAWLRDHGLRSLPIEVPFGQSKVFEARFGTVERVGSIL